MLLDGDQIQSPHNYGDQKPFSHHMQVATKNISITTWVWQLKTF